MAGGAGARGRPVEKRAQCLRARLKKQRRCPRHLTHPLPTQQSVSYKQLARKHGLHVDIAKAALFAFAERAGSSAVSATFLVGGYRPDGSHTVRLVPAADLDAARGEFNPVTGVHCFAVAPAARHGGGTGATALWSGDAADEATLYDGAVAGGDNALVDGRCSAVECPGLVRVARPVKPAKAAPPPPSAPKPATKPAVPAAKPTAKKKGGGIAAQIKRAAAAAPKRSAPAAADGSDSDGPVRAGRRSVPRVDSSDDEEPAPPADPYAEEEGVPSPSPAAAAAARGAGVAPKKRKVTRTTINENGEEVTEEVCEDGGGEEAGAAPPPPPPPRKAASPAAKKRPSPAPKGTVAPAKGQTKATAAKGTKSIASFFSRKK